MDTETQAMFADLEKQLRGDAWPGKLLRLLRTLHNERTPAAPPDTTLVDATREIATTLGRLVVIIEAANCPDNPQAELPTVALPSSWARVHMLGHQEHVGEVSRAEGGALLIHGLKWTTSPPEVRRYHVTAERHGRHSIEWLTESQWLAHVAEVEALSAQEVERERRRNTLPPGYEDYQRRGSDGFVAPDGQVWGWWYSKIYARGAAWDHADGNMEDMDGYARFPRISASGVDSTDLNDPRSPAYIEQKLTLSVTDETLASWQEDTEPGDDGRPLGDLTAAIVHCVQEQRARALESELGDKFDSRFTGVASTDEAGAAALTFARVQDSVSLLSGDVIDGRTDRDINRATKHAVQVLTELQRLDANT